RQDHPQGRGVPGFKGGAGSVAGAAQYRASAAAAEPDHGYGEVLGTGCLTSLEEEQSHLLAGGIPRKQGFSLEFVSYGDDLQNV
ncbi:phage tail protein, partial [Pseudomonas morbosilactucae]|uniref:phage tail protein n=1 Tax=Pseudomonas morbosilactucae TaxID=2938197 RepID=UPI003CC52334